MREVRERSSVRAPPSRWSPTGHRWQLGSERWQSEQGWRGKQWRKPEVRQRLTVASTDQEVLCFYVFIDGLGDRITMVKLLSIFSKAGNLRDVFIQQRKKVGRRFRFGFVRFQRNEEAWKAIRMFNGLRLEGNFLAVQKANYHVHHGLRCR